MTIARRIYSREFKLKAVELSYKRENIKELADELGIRPELLYRWRRAVGTEQAVSFPAMDKRSCL
ncbi:MAG: transposase [Granulosicoccus sp.]|jgi:transposase